VTRKNSEVERPVVEVTNPLKVYRDGATSSQRDGAEADEEKL
jgi:hypothetical protein